MPKKTEERIDDPERDCAVDFIERIHALRKEYAAAIIANGLGNSFIGYGHTVLFALAEDRTKAEQEQFQAIFDRIHAVDPELIKWTPAEGEDYPGWADDALTNMLAQYADVAFELGVAVGMQLGPHAFGSEGGAR